VRGKYVITADVHIHPFKVCSRDNGADRLRDGLSALQQTLDYADQYDATWVMAGDFKMPKNTWPQEALTGSLEILRRYGTVRKYMIAGNHDGNGLGGSGLQPFYEVASVIDREAQDSEGMLYVPFGADLKAVKTNKHLPIVAHAFLAGAIIGAEDLQLSNAGIELAEFGQPPVAFFGDIHGAQMRLPADPKMGRTARWERIENTGKIRVPGPWRGEVYYPGSPYQQNWGERNQTKGCLLVDLEIGSVHFLPIIAPRFTHVELQDCEMLPNILLAADPRDFIRVITDSAKWTAEAIEAKKLSYRWLQITERARYTKSQKRAVVHAAMSKGEIIDNYMKTRPLPEGVTPEQVKTAMLRLWGAE
jgi:DNA repair exonuclease SbcCD nuclease subunit